VVEAVALVVLMRQVALVEVLLKILEEQEILWVHLETLQVLVELIQVQVVVVNLEDLVELQAQEDPVFVF
jgi:hypothetical protein